MDRFKGLPQEAPRTVNGIEEGILSLNNGQISQDTIIIANAAAGLAVGEAWRGSDVDASVNDGLYRWWREQPGSVETILPDGRPHVTNGYLDIAVGWGSTPHTDLADRAWKTEQGLYVAGLPDVYDHKQGRNELRDQNDMRYIRNWLRDPEQKPLPENMMPSEIAIALDCLPEHLLTDDNIDPIAIRLIAENMLAEFTLGGDPRIGRFNQIIGDLELPEYLVPASYHNGFDIAKELKLMGKRFAKMQTELGSAMPFSTEDQYDALIAHSGSDRVYGFGRETNYDINGNPIDNSGRNDEYLSANVLRSRAIQLGYPRSRAARLFRAVENTGFDEQAGTQKGQAHPDPVVREVSGRDLHVLSHPGSVEEVGNLLVENGFSGRANPLRPLGQVALNENVPLLRTHTAIVEFVDRHGDYRPLGDPKRRTLMQIYGQGYLGNAEFHDPDTGNGYKAPEGYPGNPEIRRLHAEELRRIGNAIIAGNNFGAVDGQQAAKAHAARIIEQFGDEE